MLPFPYNLMAAWGREPGPDPWMACEVDEVYGPYLEEADRRWWMSEAWPRNCSRFDLSKCVRFWKNEDFSPRFLHTGRPEELASYQQQWFGARIASSDEFVALEAKHKTEKERLDLHLRLTDLEERRDHLFQSAQSYIELFNDLESLEEVFRRQELEGTYLVLSIAAGWEVPLRPGFECSPFAQFAHLSASLGRDIHPVVLRRAEPLEHDRIRHLVVAAKKTFDKAHEALIELGFRIEVSDDDDDDDDDDNMDGHSAMDLDNDDDNNSHSDSNSDMDLDGDSYCSVYGEPDERSMQWE
ncbi:hypothetical protein HDK90DRAFT_506409 [Phyllosticta capitalensis]|uniref:Uncharacterized protein n=1 Tax=Phyllosticta capitalensis TaxID=121624 RepID=A0ABR1Z3A7_9PEZI